MPRAMWSGAISFGLVSIPVKAYPATEEQSLQFHQLHEKDGTRIHYERTCAKEHRDIPFDEIVKGYEYSKGKYVVLTDSDLEAVAVESSRTVDVAYFIAPDDIDPVYFDRPYYLVPEAAGLKAYALMHKVLLDEERCAVGKVAFRQKEHLAVIRPLGKGLVLHTAHWPAEVRPMEFESLTDLPKPSAREVDMARSLVRGLTEEWNPKDFKDEYRDALLDIVEKKVAGEEILAPEVDRSEPIGDLMEALRRSVEASRAKKPRASASRRSSSSSKKKPASRTKKSTSTHARRKAS